MLFAGGITGGQWPVAVLNSLAGLINGFVGELDGVLGRGGFFTVLISGLFI